MASLRLDTENMCPISGKAQLKKKSANMSSNPRRSRMSQNHYKKRDIILIKHIDIIQAKSHGGIIHYMFSKSTASHDFTLFHIVSEYHRI
ncbi:hypothetical protein XENTR_v10017689 [Xenopus tropicalis]|nr:hypothetical protein XENTR_v10017689 [Xenopus tropicalis]